MDHLELSKIIEAITKPYQDKIVELESKLKVSEKHQVASNRSMDIKELAVALTKAQSVMEVANLNRTNPFFKSRYADLMAIVQASRPALTANGLCVIQNIVHLDDDSSTLYTILLHVSGQYIESKMRIAPTKNDIQTISSYTTYIKRMAYASLIGVVTGDEDDDGEMAAAETRNTFHKMPVLSPSTKEESPELISKDQCDVLENELDGHPDIYERVIKALKIDGLEGMRRSIFEHSLKQIQKMKHTKGSK